MREDIVLSNLGREPAASTLTIRTGADFADLFGVKAGRVHQRGDLEVEHGAGSLQLTRHWEGSSRGVRIRADGGAVASARQLVYRLVVPARGTWRTTLQVTPQIDGVELPQAFPSGGAAGEGGSVPARQQVAALRAAAFDRQRDVARDAGPQLA
jgi:hypothetical protein